MIVIKITSYEDPDSVLYLRSLEFRENGSEGMELHPDPSKAFDFETLEGAMAIQKYLVSCQLDEGEPHVDYLGDQA